MDNFKYFLRERLNGLLLLFLAGIIITGISINSYVVKSNTDLISVAVENQKPEEEQILGEENNKLENIVSDEIEDIETQEIQEKQEEKEIDENGSNEDIYYNELKVHLKKYCDKSFNVKKCYDYLLKAKEARQRGSRFKELYKKYHFDKKEEKKDSASSDVKESPQNKVSLVVKSDENSKKYEIAASPGISVMSLMDLLQKDSSQNFSYHSSSGFVDKINGTENEGNMSWMLYVCKGNVCKLSGIGASDCKVDDWDKVEWKYLDWTTVDWTTW